MKLDYIGCLVCDLHLGGSTSNERSHVSLIRCQGLNIRSSNQSDRLQPADVPLSLPKVLQSKCETKGRKTQFSPTLISVCWLSVAGVLFIVDLLNRSQTNC